MASNPWTRKSMAVISKPPPSSCRRRRCSGAQFPLFLAGACLVTAVTGFPVEGFIYVVQPGEDPWNLTHRYLKSVSYWPRIQDYNGIADPIPIQPGAKWLILLGWMPGTMVSLAGKADRLRDGQ